MQNQKLFETFEQPEVKCFFLNKSNDLMIILDRLWGTFDLRFRVAGEARHEWNVFQPLPADTENLPPESRGLLSAAGDRMGLRVKTGGMVHGE